MAKSNKQKFTYRIYCRRTGRYQTYNGKSTWNSKSWVYYRLIDESKSFRRGIDDLEVHEFPVPQPNMQSAQEFMRIQKLEEDNKKEKELEKKERIKREWEKAKYEENLRRIAELEAEVKKYKEKQ